MSRTFITRRQALGGVVGSSALVLAGCDARSSPTYQQFLTVGEGLSYRIQRLLGGASLAREFDEKDLSPKFRTNGNTEPLNDDWNRHASENFRNFALRVDGLVKTPQSLSLAALKSMPSRTQITRHDCVEGWSAIGKWTGVPLGAVLNQAGLQPNARYIVFRCADDFDGTPYYESIDLNDAFHPQTLLAYGMNGGALPIGHGAPLRLRVERQLGYKQAKFVMQIEAVARLSGIGQGKGGFWEDNANYDWYAGI